jgi:predicted MPP superfamily phosphohydrolase
MLVFALVLFAGACLGHLALMVASHNWWYGQCLPRGVGHFVKLIHGLLILAGPVLFVYWRGWDTLTVPDQATLGWSEYVIVTYVVLCWLTGFVLLPLDVVRRRLRAHPRPLLETRSRIVDIAKEVGGQPPGGGWRGLMARLPYNEVFQVDFAEKTLRLPRLPRTWDGLTILHVSDLHLNGVPDRTWHQSVMRRCAAWEPDLVAVTGDIADSIEHHRWIIPVLGQLRWRTAGLAILGNHDSWYEPHWVRRRLARLRFHVPGNGWERLEVRGEPLLVIGHEGPWFRPAPDLSACPQGPFRLCLSHTPDNLPWAKRAGVDLMLSGHVHGGQIRFPLVGSVVVPSKYGRRYDGGVFDEPPTVLHVSRGLSGEQPLRYNCRPEVTLLTLRCG